LDLKYKREAIGLDRRDCNCGELWSDVSSGGVVYSGGIVYSDKVFLRFADRVRGIDDD
jgi:hypothetical protein